MPRDDRPGRSPIRIGFGLQVRSARLDRDWTQQDLATRAGLSRPLVSAIEHGSARASIEALERTSLALDADCVLELRSPLVIGRADQRDAAHAACVAAVRRALERCGYTCVTEVPFQDGRLRGWIDILAFDAVSRRLVVVEIKTELRDMGGLQRQVGWYARVAHDAGLTLGWRPRGTECLVVFLATDENDSALEANRDSVLATFAVRGRTLFAALEARTPLGSWGLAMVDPRRRGASVWIGLRLDGRRRPAPYRSYADFINVAHMRKPTPQARRRASRLSARQKLSLGQPD